MKRIKISKKIAFFMALLSLSMMFGACDTDECFTNDGNYQNNTQKALPGTVPNPDVDC